MTTQPPTDCERVALFLAGELDGEQASAFRDHLPDCASCQGALQAGLWVEAQKAPRTRWTAVRERMRAHPAAAALVALAFLAPSARVAVGLAPVALEEGPYRNHREWIDGPFAEAHHPFKEASRATMSGDSLAADLRYDETQDRIDWLLGKPRRLLASAANALVHSDERRARAYLAQLERLQDGAPGLTASVLNAQAVLELRQAERFEAASCHQPWEEALPRAEQQGACDERIRHLGRALALLARAQEKSPGHAPSLFNQGLVLESLGLEATAAEAFEASARQGAPGWSGEAEEASRRLRRGAEAERARLEKVRSVLQSLAGTLPRAQEASPAEAREAQASVAAAASLVAELRAASQDPEPLRKKLYLTAAAGTGYQRRLLVPLAEALDGPGSPLAARLARPESAAGPLLQRYLGRAGLDEAGLHALLADLDRAHEDELLLWLLEDSLQKGQDVPVSESSFERMRQREPFVSLLATRLLAQKRQAAGDVESATRLLRSLADGCDARESRTRCADVELWLVWAYAYRDRWSDAHARGLRGLALADQGSDLWLWHLNMMAVLASTRNDPWLGLAYASELSARAPRCSQLRSRASVRMAAIRLYSLLDVEGSVNALREAVQPAGCPAGDFSTIGKAGADVVTALVATGRAPPEWAGRLEEALRQHRKRAQGQADPSGEYLEARAALVRNREEGRRVLEALASGEERGGPDLAASKVRSYAYRDLALDVGATGDFARAFELVARQLRLKAPERCALTVTSDLGNTVVVARDARGSIHGHHVQNGWRWVDRGGDQLVPAGIQRALAECPEVAVLASPGVFGLTRLLSGVPWSYRVSQGYSGQAGRRPHRLVVANTEPPAALLLDRLTPWRGRRDLDTVLLERAQATLTRVMGELPAATEVELYTHGIQKLNDAEGAYLVLTPDGGRGGEYRLTAADVRSLSLDGAPHVYLKACVTADAGLQNDTNRSLASAFVERGARAVFASTVSIPDVDADGFFNAIREQIRGGASPAAALFNVREAAREGEGAQAQSWMDGVVCLQPG